MTQDAAHRRLLTRLAIGLGLFAVLAVTVSFFTDGDGWGLRGTAMVLIILGLAIGRYARQQPPPVE